MYATLKFDVEDVYYPPEHRIDDIPGWLSEIMTQCGIIGTMCVTGEKARLLKDRGREDVLAAMGRHDIVSHQRGNFHPLVPEAVEGLGWEDGVEAMKRYEDKVNEDLLHAFRREAAGLSRHNLYFAAQHVAVAGLRGIPYMSLQAGATGTEQPVWYAGALSLPCGTTPAFGGFDTIYSCDEAFEARLRAMDEFLDACASRGVEYVSLFGCHPVRVMAHGWLEHYVVASGLQRSVEDVGWLYAVKPPALEARAKANFRRLCEHLANRQDVEVMGVSEAAKRFAAQPQEIYRDELAEYAEQVAAAGKPILHRTFSPAEMLCGLAESIVAEEAGGGLPYEVARRDVPGPTSRPVTGREADIVTHEQLVAMCRQTMDAVAEGGALPANVTTPAARVGTGQLLVLAARAYAALARDERLQRLRVLETQRYPDEALALDARVRRGIGEHWGFRLDFSCEALAEHARLQTWTIKPAWLRPPRGQSREQEGRIVL